MKLRKAAYIAVTALIFAVLMGLGRVGVEWNFEHTIRTAVFLVYTCLWLPVGVFIGWKRWERKMMRSEIKG